MSRIGIIGLGMMGRTHYEAYQKILDAQVVMIADRNPKRAAGDVSGEWGNLGTGNIRDAQSNANGQFSFPDLSFGRFEISVTAPGFQTSVLKDVTKPIEIAVASAPGSPSRTAEAMISR